MNDLMAGRKGLVMGVANDRSIAWGISRVMAQCGARLGFTYQGERLAGRVKPLVDQLEGDFLVECDVTRDGDVEKLFAQVEKEWGGLDFVVHSLAFADKKDLGASYVETSRDGFLLAQDISAYSFTQVAHHASKLMPEGGSMLTLTYLGGERVVPGYNVMGVAKASLEMSVRYLANDLGPRNIRVNALSAGPVNTLAARGVGGFTKMLDVHEERAPLRRNVTLDEIGQTAAFLLSSWSSGVTGEVVHVDGGFHVMGM